MFDNFVYKCPNCGKTTHSQTKFSSCLMNQFRLGDYFPQNGNILMKDPCHKCDNYNTVIIKDDKIIGFAKEIKANFKEGPYGSIEKIERDELLEVMDELTNIKGAC